MKVNLISKLLFFLILAGIFTLSISCDNDNKIDHKIPSPTKTEQPNSFVSKLNEPWESLLSSRHQYYDFFWKSLFQDGKYR